MADQILEINGGTEWTCDPVAWLGDPSYYQPFIEEARRVLDEHPTLDLVRVGDVGDAGDFLDLAEEPGLQVVGQFEGEDVYVCDSWDVTWVFAGVYVSRHSAWLNWYNKRGNEELFCDLPKVGG